MTAIIYLNIKSEVANNKTVEGKVKRQEWALNYEGSFTSGRLNKR